MTFHVDQYTSGMFFTVGAVTASKVSDGQYSYFRWAGCVGYVYCASGNVYAEKGYPLTTKFDEYDTGDNITVQLDVDASTVAFRKNGTDAGAPQKITHGEAYYFAFDSETEGDAVTITEVK